MSLGPQDGAVGSAYIRSPIQSAVIAIISITIVVGLITVTIILNYDMRPNSIANRTRCGCGGGGAGGCDATHAGAHRHRTTTA